VRTAAAAVLLGLVGAAIAVRSVESGAGGPAMSLDGTWRYLPYEGRADLARPDLDDGRWPTMELPSSWFLRGSKSYPVDSDLKPKPFEAHVNWGTLEPPAPGRGLDWTGHVWFRRGFDWSGDPGRPAVLRFEAVDYFADVYVNGERVGSHEGFFQPFEFEVAKALKRGHNVVAVRVGAPLEPFDPAEELPASWPKRQTQIKGVFGYHDTRPGSHTARGQERSTGGILASVTLRQPPDVEVAASRVAPLDVSERQATLEITWELRNWTAGRKTGRLAARVAPETFEGPVADAFEVPYDAAPGTSTVSARRTLTSPRLWWTWDLGEPALYRLESAIPGHERRDTFGVRSVTRDGGQVFRLNGHRFFARGTNYIATQWLSQADRAFYAKDVELMKRANLNAVRVHAHLERPDFYDLADRAGLLVWQDFPLQWGYTDEPWFREEAVRQAGDMVRLLFNHPSIALWCMHNESPHAQEWMVRKVKDQNLALDEALVAEARRLDATRIAHRDSGTGDQHPYPGWYQGVAADYSKLPGTPLISEYGAQALPSAASLRRTFPEALAWPDTDADWQEWMFRDFQKEITFQRAKVPMGSSLEEFSAASQRYQAALLRFSTEGYRRAKWTKVTGLYQFMFVDDWPSITWSVVDYWREPKLGYHLLARAMQPVLPSIEYALDDPGRPLALWVVNDVRKPFPGARVQWTRGGASDGRVVDVPADGVVKVADLGPLPGVGAGSETLVVELRDAQGQLVGTNRLEASDFLPWKQ
jgi:beta-mannosidase